MCNEQFKYFIKKNTEKITNTINTYNHICLTLRCNKL